MTLVRTPFIDLVKQNKWYSNCALDIVGWEPTYTEWAKQKHLTYSQWNNAASCRWLPNTCIAAKLIAALTNIDYNPKYVCACLESLCTFTCIYLVHNICFTMGYSIQFLIKITQIRLFSKTIHS